MEIMTTHGVGRPLSEAQRSHLSALIAAMNVAQVQLLAAQKVAAAQAEAAQSLFDNAQAQAQAFLNYCGAELGCTFSDGDWQFDQQIMAFVRVEPVPAPDTSPAGNPPASGRVSSLATQAAEKGFPPLDAAGAPQIAGALEPEPIHENGKAT